MPMLALHAMNDSNRPPVIVLILFVFAAFVLAACNPAPTQESMQVVVIADNRQRAFEQPQQVTVGQFLDLIGLELGELDLLNPPKTTQIQDGMTITVVRVEEQVDCDQNPLPFQQQTVPSEGLQSGEERLAQPGVNGIEEVCYRTTIEDGQPRDRVEIRRVVVQAPQDQIMWVGVDTANLETVPITGTLAYLSNGDVWLMRGSNATKRPLTTGGGADGKAFALSQDGNQALFTRQYTGEETDIYFNTLWVILDTHASEPEAQELSLLNNILYAEWVPFQPYTFTYSAAESREAAPGWQAFNDLWLMRLDPNSGQVLSPRNILEASSGGVYGWWGTQFRWSPDGSALAWARADSVGLLDLDNGEFQPLLSFPVYTTFQDWVWQPTLSWSPDNLMLATTVHGLPFGSEPAESSPIFNVAVAAANGEFLAEVVDRAGIWAAPVFSPFLEDQTGEFPQAYVAYLRARSPLNSRTSDYDLVVADRDGSNARVLFPEVGAPGLQPQNMVWSPDGKQLAFVYQQNLWIVDAGSGRAQQLTIDASASSPQWMP